MWLFGRRTRAAEAPPPVTEIVVPQGALDAPEPYALPCAVVDYVNHLMHTAFYRRDELPREALLSYHVDYYLAQVNNGGHGQFVGNSGWMEATVADIRDGLAAMRLDDAAAIFADLERFAAEEPERFRLAGEGGGFGEIDPVIRALDDRFFAGPSGSIAAGNGAWLRMLPNLRVVPDAEHRAALDRLTAANGALEARRAEGERLAREAQERDPLVQAFEFLVRRARPPLAYMGWTAGYPQTTEDGVPLHVFGVQTDQGIVQAVFFPDWAALFRTVADGPLVSVPMAELDRAVARKTGQSIREVLTLR